MLSLPVMFSAFFFFMWKIYHAVDASCKSCLSVLHCFNFYPFLQGLIWSQYFLLEKMNCLNKLQTPKDRGSETYKVECRKWWGLLYHCFMPEESFSTVLAWYLTGNLFTQLVSSLAIALFLCECFDMCLWLNSIICIPSQICFNRKNWLLFI